MAEAIIEVGDVVQLRSGGPKMTVTEVEPLGKVLAICVWFNGFDRHEGSFHARALKVVGEDD